MVAVVVLAVAAVAAELALRAALFGPIPVASLRRPERYADWFSDDDYWKLAYAFGSPFPPPEHPHPVLGWVGRFSRDTYLHDDAAAVGARTPVLLFGDSFAGCMPGVECFQHLLNGDPRFSEGHYLLNYGVGGYGTDQILLLMRRALDLYADPFVVIGVMTTDLDRSALSVRTGQKPRFTLAGGELALEPTEILPRAADFYAAHPPSIRSYLYRLARESRVVPRALRARLRDEEGRREAKRALNRAIVSAMVDEVRRRDLRFVVVVFHPHLPGVTTLDGPPDWRDVFLRDLLEELEVPYVWSKDLIQTPGEPLDPEEWIVPGDGHPTAAFNRRIAGEILERVLDR